MLPTAFSGITLRNAHDTLDRFETYYCDMTGMYRGRPTTTCMKVA